MNGCVAVGVPDEKFYFQYYLPVLIILHLLSEILYCYYHEAVLFDVIMNSWWLLTHLDTHMQMQL